LTEGRGGALEAYQESERGQGLAGQEGVNSAAESPGPGVWAAALDAAKVRFDDGWHDVKAGVVYWATPRWDEVGMVEGEATSQSYLGEVGPMEQAGARLYGEAVLRGIDPGEELVVCLGEEHRPHRVKPGVGLHFPKRVEGAGLVPCRRALMGRR
jgi:hypothetical protein